MRGATKNRRSVAALLTGCVVWWRGRPAVALVYRSIFCLHQESSRVIFRFFSYFGETEMGAGAGASAPGSHISEDRKREVTAHMRKIYEDAVRSGSSDAELAALLNTGLSSLMSPQPNLSSSQVANSNFVPTESPGRGPSALSAMPQAQQVKPTGLKKGMMPTVGGSSDASTARAGAASNRPKLQRRRSYGEKEANKITSAGKSGGGASKGSDSSLLLGSISEAQLAASGAVSQPSAGDQTRGDDSGTTSLATDELAADHWDSVRELPYCPLCAMAFKSVSVLERHIKYSDMHLKAVAAQTAQQAAKSTVEEKVPEAPKPLPRQVEGQDYKLLYYGSKFFWRSQDNIDLSFFHHMACSIVEVVPFDVYKNTELERLYFDLYVIHENIDGEVESKLVELREKFKQDNKHDKFQSATFNEVHEKAQLTRVALTTYILTRLQLHVVVSDGSKVTSQIRFQESTQSFSEKTPVLSLDKVPKVLIPVSVTHRRNTSTEEVKQKLTELADDQAALKSAINKAETIASMVHRFASIYSSRKQLLVYSIPRRRWILAIKKVIQINAVKRVRELLRLREDAKAKSDGSPSRRKRGQSMYRKEV